MKRPSNIEWTNISWNPTTGCSKVSPGCKYCYAEIWANMHQKRGIQQYQNGFELALAPQRLLDPLHYRGQNLVFVNSMSDLFHEDVPTEYLLKIFDIMNRCPDQKFQILTKRPERILMLKEKVKWTQNIWVGVSVESAKYIHRIATLLRVPSEVRFISFEPLIERIGIVQLKGIDWVIVGGESGVKARTIKEEWVLEIQEQCKQLKIPFFFKQWGKTKFNPDNMDPTKDKSHPSYAQGGCSLKKEIHREFPKIFARK